MHPGREEFGTGELLQGVLVHIVPGGPRARLGRIAHKWQFENFRTWEAPCSVARQRDNQVIHAVFDPVDELGRSPTTTHGWENLTLQPITRFACNLLAPGGDHVDRGHRLWIPDVVEFKRHLLRRRWCHQNGGHRSTN